MRLINNMRSLQKTPFALLIILGLTFFSYFNILNNQFVWDDYEFIVQWETPRNFSNFPEFLKGVTPPGHEGVYRPVRTMLYSVAMNFFGTQNPFPYHLQGLLIHLLVTSVIFFIVKKLTDNSLLSFITALLFGLHPIHIENVSFATANFDLFGLLFMFGAYLLYLVSERGKKKLLLIISLFFAFLALFTYELSLPLIILIIMADFFFHEKHKNIKYSLPLYGLFLIPTALYFFIRFVVVHVPTRSGFMLDNFYLTMLTMAKVFLRYIQLLIFPLDLNVIPTIAPGITALRAESAAAANQSIFEIQTILAVCIIIGIIASIILLYKRHKIASFALVWILITMLPFANVIPVGILFSERYLYAVSFGLCLFIAYWVVFIFELKNIASLAKKATIGVLIVLLGFYFVRTVTRNNDWQNSVALWEQTISRSPENPDMYNNAGIAYSQAGDNKGAIQKFQEAIKLNNKDARYYANMALSMWNSGQFYNAMEAWEQAHTLDLDNEVYTINLARAYLAFKQEKTAITLLSTAQFEGYEYQAQYMLGEAYFKIGAYDLAESNFAESIKIKPDYAEAYGGLASVYMVKKDYKKAQQLLTTSIRLNSHFAPSYHNLALIYVTRQEYNQALAMVNQALNLQPNFPEAQQLKESITRFLKARENRTTK